MHETLSSQATVPTARFTFGFGGDGDFFQSKTRAEEGRITEESGRRLNHPSEPDHAEEREMNRRKAKNGELPRGCSHVFTFVWSGSFLIAGFILLTIGLWQFDEIVSSRSWPSVDGRVLSKSIEVKKFRDRDGGKTRKYTPTVSYQYTVDGQTYRGNRLRINVWRYKKRNAAAIALERLTSNGQCLVYYDADHPDRSLLTVGFTWGDFLLPSLGIIFCFFGCVGGRLMLAGSRRHQ